MSDLFWLKEARLARLRPFVGRQSPDCLLSAKLPKRRGRPRAYGLQKTLDNRWRRWSGMGVFAGILVEIADLGIETRAVMIDVGSRTPCVRLSLRKHRKAHRTSFSLRAERGRARD